MEEKKKRSTLGMVLEGAFIVVVAAILVYFALGQLLLPRETDASYQRCEIFDTPWEQVFTDGSRESVEVPGVCKASPGVPFVIETVLGDIETNSSLSFYSIKQDMKIYVGDELRTTYSTKETRILGNSSIRNIISFCKITGFPCFLILIFKFFSSSIYTVIF